MRDLSIRIHYWHRRCNALYEALKIGNTTLPSYASFMNLLYYLIEGSFMNFYGAGAAHLSQRKKRTKTTRVGKITQISSMVAKKVTPTETLKHAIASSMSGEALLFVQAARKQTKK